MDFIVVIYFCYPDLLFCCLFVWSYVCNTEVHSVAQAFLLHMNLWEILEGKAAVIYPEGVPYLPYQGCDGCNYGGCRLEINLDSGAWLCMDLDRCW